MLRNGVITKKNPNFVEQKLVVKSNFHTSALS